MPKLCIILYLLIILISTNMKAQVNYVLNPSFEQYSRCPYNVDQIKFSTNWTTIDTSYFSPIDSFGNPYCSAEYCNKCSLGTSVGVPYGGIYYHYPRTGNGMVQMQMFTDDTSSLPYKRDYIQGKIFQQLINGKSYCVTFYVTLEQGSNYAINHIGAYLDNGEIDTTQNCGLPQTTHIPQILTQTIINDTLNWIKIEGSFIATGTEKYITVGNFSDKAHTNYIPSISGASGGYTWYLVDDVSVVESNIPAYAGGTFFKAKTDSVFIGRNEIIPDCEWYRNGILIDTVRAGFWVKDTVNTTYVVKQSICGNIKYDTAYIVIARLGVPSVGNKSMFKIFPNPAQHEITIQAPNNTNTAAIAIYDFSGRIVLRQEGDFVGGECKVPLSLSTGAYFVEIVDKDGGKNIQRLSVL